MYITNVLIFCALILVAIAPASALAQSNTATEGTPSQKHLHIVTDSWPPYVISSPQQGGIDLETSKLVLESMGYHVRIEFVPWKRALEMVKQGMADALLDVGFNEKRKQYYIYPNTPINYSVSTLFCIRCDRSKYTTNDELIGKRVAINRGYSYAGEFDEDVRIEKIQVNEFSQGFELLELGRVDFYAVNRLVGQYTANKIGLKNAKPLNNNLSDPNPVYLAFSKKKNHQNLSKEFSSALKIFLNTNQYLVLKKKYGLEH